MSQFLEPGNVISSTKKDSADMIKLWLERRRPNFLDYPGAFLKMENLFWLCSEI
jgi:hypothetical protein